MIELEQDAEDQVVVVDVVAVAASDVGLRRLRRELLVLGFGQPRHPSLRRMLLSSPIHGSAHITGLFS